MCTCGLWPAMKPKEEEAHMSQTQYLPLTMNSEALLIGQYEMIHDEVTRVPLTSHGCDFLLLFQF